MEKLVEMFPTEMADMYEEVAGGIDDIRDMTTHIVAKEISVPMPTPILGEKD
jgi:hypothetical protein